MLLCQEGGRAGQRSRRRAAPPPPRTGTSSSRAPSSKFGARVPIAATAGNLGIRVLQQGLPSSRQACGTQGGDLLGPCTTKAEAGPGMALDPAKSHA